MAQRPEPVGQPKRGLPAVSPMVGREREFAQIRGWIEEASDVARGSVVLLSGEAGIGKTRLAQEIASSARADGWDTLWGACREHAGAPAYWPWIHALRGAPLERFKAALGNEATGRAPQLMQLLLGDRAADESQAPTGSEQARFMLFDELSSFLRASARGRPLLVVLEDLHWADQPSLQLLEFIAADIHEAPLVIVGTFRDDELSREHPLSETLGLLAGQSRVDRIRMPRLSAAALRQLLAHATGQVPTARLVDAIHSRTAGNPFFAQEVIRLLMETDGLDADGLESLPPTIPDTVRGAIGRRLNRLSDECIELLGLAAVLGPEYDLLTLQTVGRSEEGVEQALSEAFAAGILVETFGEARGYRFSHPLIREELYEGLGTARRARLHRLVGEGLEEMRGLDSGSHLNELAFHFREAAPVSGAGKAVDYLRRAGERSAAQFAWTDAIRDLEAALTLHAQTAGGDRRTRVELMVSLGSAQADSGAEPTAVETLREAADSAAELGDPVLAARAAHAYAKWASFASFGFDAPEIAPRLERALELLGDSDPLLRARLLGELSSSSLYLPRDAPLAGEPVALSTEAVSLARKSGNTTAVSEALIHAYRVAWPPELLDRRLEVASELLAVSEAADNVPHILQGHVFMICALLERGETSLAGKRADEVRELTERFGSPRHRAYGHLRKSWIGLIRGDFAAAEADARAAMAQGVPATESFGVAALAMVGKAQGRLEEFEHVITPDFFSRCEALGGSGRVVLALVNEALGYVTECQMRYEALAEVDFETIERDSDRAPAFAGLAELCVALGDTRRAPLLYELLEPYRDLMAVSHMGVYGSMARHLGLLAALLGRTDEAAAHFEHALERNAQSEARPWLAWTQADYAALLIERNEGGDRRQARGLLAKAHSTARALGMAPLAARCTSLDDTLGSAPAVPPDGLTAREVEVLALVAHGLSNAEVAEELVLSVRTVERHITNLYGKIGAKGRADAATYAMSQHLIELEVAE